VDEPCDSAYARACPGCPAMASRRFPDLVGCGRGECRFRLATVEEHARVPSRMLHEYAFALVRHGVFVRTREDESGAVHVVDAAGPGGLVLGSSDEHDGAAGYAVGHLVLCLLPRLGAAQALARSGETVDDFVTLVGRAHARMERLAGVRMLTKMTTRVGALVALLAETLAPNGEPLKRLPAMLQQRDLARLGAIRHETVCRAIAQLERRGLLERSTEGLLIHDHAALARA
jgi:hypothetical protein